LKNLRLDDIWFFYIYQCLLFIVCHHFGVLALSTIFFVYLCRHVFSHLSADVWSFDRYGAFLITEQNYQAKLNKYCAWNDPT
jgi:hypothetical protein